MWPRLAGLALVVGVCATLAIAGLSADIWPNPLLPTQPTDPTTACSSQPVAQLPAGIWPNPLTPALPSDVWPNPLAPTQPTDPLATPAPTDPTIACSPQPAPAIDPLTSPFSPF